MNRAGLRRHWRSLLLGLGALLLAATALGPHWTLPRPVYRLLFVLDITQSMLARDYRLGREPVDRLEYAKAAIEDAIAGLPCGSAAGLALFTEKNVQTLFEPIEVCEHFPVIADTLQHIHWRMAWAADSYIERGLYNSLRETARIGNGTRLVFLSDGQQQTPAADAPGYRGKPGEIGGLVVGVGGLQPVPVPHYDAEGRPAGYWTEREVAELAVDNLLAAGIDPAALYLSALDERRLGELSRRLGLGYHRLESVEDLGPALRRGRLAEWRWVRGDLRWLLGVCALGAAVCAWLPERRRDEPT